MALRLLTLLALSLAAHGPALAACADDALGTARLLAVDARNTPRVGLKHFPATLPLAPMEVVLTFDDGPWPGTTDRVLDALRRECVRATFFLVGRNAASHPALARRILADGHTVANHTFSHPLLDRIPADRAVAEIERGFAAIGAALGGGAGAAAVAPFFRFPGFASTPELLERLERRGIVTFGADLWASDWNPMTAQQTLAQVLGRLERTRGGIVLFHDTQPHTAGMLPALLREMRRRGYRVVHAVPASAGPFPGSLVPESLAPESAAR